MATASNDFTDAAPRNRHERRRVNAGLLAYSIDDFAVAAGIGRTKVYAEIAAKRLRAKKIGSRTVIPAQAADEYFAALPDMAA